MSCRLSFSYPEELKNKIKALADKDDRSVSNYIKQVLELHLKNLPKTNNSSKVEDKHKNKTKKSLRRKQ